MKNDTYNGWTNYATWRVQTEFFADMDAHEVRDQISGMDLAAVAYHAKETAEKFIFDTFAEVYDNPQAQTVRGWAGAFLFEVNWREIAEALAETAGIEPRQ
jgi:hypothetical protein